MDEPLVGARPRDQGRDPAVPRAAARHSSLPIVYVTHDIAEVERLADQLVLMEKGRVLAAGPLADLQSDPSLPLAMARERRSGWTASWRRTTRATACSRSACGGRFLAPAPPAAIGDTPPAHRRQRREPRPRTPGPSSISTPAWESRDHGSGRFKRILAVVALGADGEGAPLLSRLTRKSWEQLGLAEGVNVYAQVKAVALGPGRGDFGE